MPLHRAASRACSGRPSAGSPPRPASSRFAAAAPPASESASRAPRPEHGVATARAYLAMLLPIAGAQLCTNLLMQVDTGLLGHFLSDSAGSATPSSRDVVKAWVAVYKECQTFAFLPYQLLFSVTLILFPMLARASRRERRRVRQGGSTSPRRRAAARRSSAGSSSRSWSPCRSRSSSRSRTGADAAKGAPVLAASWSSARARSPFWGSPPRSSRRPRQGAPGRGRHVARRRGRRGRVLRGRPRGGVRSGPAGPVGPGNGGRAGRRRPRSRGAGRAARRRVRPRPDRGARRPGTGRLLRAGARAAPGCRGVSHPLPRSQWRVATLPSLAATGELGRADLATARALVRRKGK